MVFLQIDQKVDKNWPLLVIDNQGNNRKIFLEPGEMILYESAKMPHEGTLRPKKNYVSRYMDWANMHHSGSVLCKHLL